jgi:hypothetical protein
MELEELTSLAQVVTERLREHIAKVAIPESFGYDTGVPSKRK